MARGGAYDYRKHLLRDLRLLVWPEGQGERRGLVYRGPADFVLQHGEWFEPRPLPEGYAAGAPKVCFGNSINAAVLHGIDYVEGYAVDPGSSGLVIHHGWSADADGLVDTTWGRWRGLDAPGRAYLGVRFSVERADDCTWNGDASVLDDFTRGWPLLRSRWEGEPPGLVWPPSPRLDLLCRFADGDVAGARAMYHEHVEPEAVAGS